MTDASEPAEITNEFPMVVSTERRRWWNVLRVVGTLSFVAAVFVGVIVKILPTGNDDAFGWVTIVLGDWIPTWWTAEVVLVVIGITASLGAMFVCPSKQSRPGVGLRILVAVVLVLAVPVSFLTVGLDASSFSVLSKQSDGGCRIVVREYSLLLLGEGSVGIVQPGSVTVDWLGDYWGDDGYMPFTAGTYVLDWSGETASLEIAGKRPNWAAWNSEQPPIICAG